MHRALPLLLLLSACSAPAPAPDGPQPGTYAGSGRDRLCIAGEGDSLRAGLIAYAEGSDANCSMAGRIEGTGSRWTLVPQGEGACRITLDIGRGGIAVTGVGQACGYYCGPKASLVGRRFAPGPVSGQAVDLAGEPLC